MTCVPCQKQFPFQTTLNQILNAIDETKISDVAPSECLAVLVKETGCSANFNTRDELLLANLKALSEGTGLDPAIFLSAYQHIDDEQRKVVPKFRFEPSWWKVVHKEKADTSLKTVELVAFACSWGIAQRGGIHFYMNHIDRMDFEDLHEFMLDKDLQLQHLVMDLHEIKKRKVVNFAEVASKYNAGMNHEGVTLYGANVATLEFALRARMKKEGLI